MIRNSNSAPPLVIGLTGGTGAGKGEASKILSSMGCEIILTDEMSKNLMKYGQDCYAQVVEYFGTDILLDNKEIDRKKLAQIVFNDKGKLEVLSKTVHKFVKENTNTIIKNSKSKVIIIDAPLLIEANMQELTHYMIGIFAPRSLRISRIIKRDSLDETAAISRLNAQMDDDTLRTLVDFAIENNKGIAELKEQVEGVMKQIQIQALD